MAVLTRKQAEQHEAGSKEHCVLGLDSQKKRLGYKTDIEQTCREAGQETGMALFQVDVGRQGRAETV